MNAKHIGILDGLRGGLAFWVFVAHLITAVDVHLEIPSAILAVDLFMFLSGFLMAWHWLDRAGRFSSGAAQTLDFYVRRFFRIAPLYYLVLTFALVGQSHFFAAKAAVEQTYPPAWAEKAGHFASPTDSTLTVTNFLAHYSFLFGFFPKYAANNALPDWSIGLEMQFYMFFPFLMAAMSRFGAITLGLGATLAAWVTHRAFGLYLESGPLGNFPEPAMLLFKLNVFFGGMILARCLIERKKGSLEPTSLLLFAVLLAASLYPSGMIVTSIAFVIALLLLRSENEPEALRGLLSGRIARLAGDVSYAVYLCHWPILYVIVQPLVSEAWFRSLAPGLRFLVGLVIVGIPVYAIAYILHRIVELPGIALGHRVVQELRSARA